MNFETQKLNVIQQINRSMVYYHTSQFNKLPLHFYDFICDKKCIASINFCVQCGNYKDIWLRKSLQKCVVCKCLIMP